jgi:SnoaL-like domain
MRPKELVQKWVEAFNRADVDALADLYGDKAINHQVAERPVEGREAIQRMFAEGFATAKMVCIVENLFEDGEWAILQWRDPLGLRGCGFFTSSTERSCFSEATGTSCLDSTGYHSRSPETEHEALDSGMRRKKRINDHTQPFHAPFFRKVLTNSWGLSAFRTRKGWVKAADISASADRSADFVQHNP